MKNIVWLASYPKSGNTWLRIFLSNLISQQDQPVDINDLEVSGIFSSNSIFEKSTGIEHEELTFDEADLLRPDIFRYYSEQFKELVFTKTHDAFTFLPNQEAIYPADVSYGAIYIVRNPLDIVVSWAHHLGETADTTTEYINRHTNKSFRIGYHFQLRQKLLTWKEHYKSWVEQTEIPTLVIRYEDMKKEPLDTFKKVVMFLGWKYSNEDILTAIHKSSFKNLRIQEQEKGFKERVENQKQFFRKGKIGDWKNHLTPKQIKIIIDFNRDVMKELFYI